MTDPLPLLRTSERSDFRRCPWLWQKAWNEGLRKKRAPTWAWFGTAIHVALEVYYPIGFKRGNKSDVIDAFLASVGDQEGRIYTQGFESDEDQEGFAEEIVDARELGVAMLSGYIDYYEGDSRWEVIHREQPFQINVPDHEGNPVVLYAGTWDLLGRDRWTKEFWLWDHKTRKTFPGEDRWGFYNINDQAGSYLWVAPEVLRHLGIFKKKDRINGLIFNALKKTLPDDRPMNDDGLATNKPQKAHYLAALEAAGLADRLPSKPTLADMADIAAHAGLRVLGDVSARQKGALFHREEVYRSPSARVTQARRVQGEALIMKQMREGTLPIYKNPTEECLRCPMFDLCEVDEEDPSAVPSMIATMYQRTDPYRDHRDDMEDKGGVRV